MFIYIYLFIYFEKVSETFFSNITDLDQCIEKLTGQELFFLKDADVDFFCVKINVKHIL